MNSPIPRTRKGLLDPERRRKGIYLLPNLFTAAALFAGFYAIVQGMNDKFEARLTRTQSEFGAQFDSLSDMVSFGAAPALVMYEWALKPMGKWGWAAAFIYCACAAMRLARFNANIGIIDKKYFQGLPSPAAAALVTGLIWVLNNYQIGGGDVRWVAWGLTVFAGITMVTNIRYYSGKDFNLRRSVPFWVVPAIFVAYLVVTIEPSHVLWGLFVCYVLSGYVMAIAEVVRPKKDQAVD
jgi:CDP-diacylglycerol---serine O-phosphatidyltransferase